VDRWSENKQRPHFKKGMGFFYSIGEIEISEAGGGCIRGVKGKSLTSRGGIFAMRLSSHFCSIDAMQI
jgi:hypothetical protein